MRLCGIRTRYCALIRRPSIQKIESVCDARYTLLAEKPSGMRKTCTPKADRVIFGKEISKRVKCFFKKQKCFRFMTILQCAKKPLHSTKQYHWDKHIIGARACFAKCFSKHLRSTRTNTPWFPMPQHFNSTKHSLSDVQVSGLALCSGTNIQRKQREMRLIFQLGAVQSKGLNINFSFIWIGTLYTSCARFDHFYVYSIALSCKTVFSHTFDTFLYFLPNITSSATFFASQLTVLLKRADCSSRIIWRTIVINIIRWY